MKHYLGIILTAVIAVAAVTTLIFNYASPACCKENSARFEKFVSVERHKTDISRIERTLERLEGTIDGNHSEIMEVLLDK